MVCVSHEDLKIVSFQLHRTPRNILKIVQKCSYGYPVVVKSMPVLDGKPFPTLFWLTCPFLRYRISKLEAEGYVMKYEKILKASPSLMARQRASHRKAGLEASKLVGKGWISESLRKRGMGGIADFSHIKCLHLHVAYHLGGIENPVGRMVLNELDETECRDEWCKAYKEVK